MTHFLNALVERTELYNSPMTKDLRKMFYLARELMAERLPEA